MARAEGGSLGGAADAQRLLVFLFVPGSALHLAPNLGSLLQRVALLAFTPRNQLSAHEVAIPVVHDGAGEAALELKICGVVARNRPLGHPLPDVRPHASNLPATEQPHCVRLM